MVKIEKKVFNYNGSEMSKSELKEIYAWQDDESLPFDKFLLNYRGFDIYLFYETRDVKV